MIEQPGRVVAAADGRAWVRVGARAGCTACDEGRGCGAGLFGRLLRDGTVDLEVRDAAGVKPGQRVQLGIPERLFLRLAWGLYGAPLLAGLAGAMAGHFATAMVDGSAPSGLLQDAAALAAGVGCAAWSLRHARRRLPREVVARGLEILPPGDAESGAELDCGATGHH